MGASESSFRRLSLRVDRAACLSSWAGSAEEVDGSEFEEWLRYDEEGRVETSDMRGREKKGFDRSDEGQSSYPPEDAETCHSMATHSSSIMVGLAQGMAFAKALSQHPLLFHRNETLLA
jgi:hypothetical protein